MKLSQMRALPLIAHHAYLGIYIYIYIYIYVIILHEVHSGQAGWKQRYRIEFRVVATTILKWHRASRGDIELRPTMVTPISFFMGLPICPPVV